MSCACCVLIYDSVHSIEMRRAEDLQGSFLVPGHTTETQGGSGTDQVSLRFCFKCLTAVREECGGHVKF